ncbi:MAG: NAD(P)-dependent oxidoreductase [Methylomicrobium sp.]|nr:NAD(P)-dependent oxidoreductase [Methylomicrobium sp.]
MRIVLTGGTGFLGSNLLHKLLANNFEVTVLKRSFSKLDRIHSVLGHQNLILFDLDKGNVEDVFAGSEINSIIHTATEYGRVGTPVHQVLETNLVYPIKLIELGIKYGVNSFINTDSYFNKENFRYSHLLNYSLSKRSLVHWLKSLSENIHVANVVLEHLYGPHDDNAKFVGNLIQNIAIDQVDRIALTHGHQKRDFIYVDDATDAFMLLLKHMNDSHVRYSEFQLGTGQSIPVRTLAETIKELSSSPTILGFGDIEYRSDEIMDSKADNSALVELGWHPQVKLHDGVIKTISSYKK